MCLFIYAKNVRSNHRYTYGKPVIGTVKLYADIDYSNTPWKYHGDEVMVEAAFDVSLHI
jgi:hypothetical protein